MKYIWFWEYNSEDMFEMFEKDGDIALEREKEPDKYPKTIFKPHWLGMENKGFTIYEADDPQQLVNMAAKFFPEKKSEFVPIFEKSMVKEAYIKMKK